MTTSAHSQQRGSRRLRSLLLLLAAFPIACAFGILGQDGYPQGEKAPPQGWLESRGPVVPHDNFPTECSLCHIGGGWHKIKEDFEFDHAKETGVTLTGAHNEAECLRCHNDRGPVKLFANRGCVGCHTDPHQGQLGRNCNSCHSDTNWLAKEVIVQHNRTRFPLIGAHAAAACFRCHPGAAAKNFKRADISCESCHQEDLASAKSPDHLAQGWTRDCERCHQPIAWGGASFLHTSFPLTGIHATIQCSACHVGNVFRGTARNCVDCHQADYNGAQNPNHTAAGFATSCDSCHRTTGWSPTSYLHQQFPINGAHLALTCSQCHVGAVYKGTGSACVDCHLNNYNATTNPNHTTAGFPTTCEACHNTTSFKGALVTDHSSFPLTGTHATVACAQCHVGGVFKGTKNTCVGCHLDNYNATTNPNHKTAGFSTDCKLCHDTTTFLGAGFNHTTFPLTGKHVTTACNLCHVNGVFKGTNRTCVGCHLTNYNNTTNPKHSLPSFPHNCDACHNTSSFLGAVFNHSFPLNGPHNKPCMKCHENPNNYGQFTCFNCHEHERTKMMQKHKDVQNYQYVPAACLNCHPNGKG